MFVKWSKQRESSASFTAKWSTSAVICCNKIKLENLFQYSGVYSLKANSGLYRQLGGHYIIFQRVNKFGFSGWFVGSDINRVALINPVSLSSIHPSDCTD